VVNKFVDHCSLQGQRMGSDFDQKLLCYLHEHNFEQYKFVGIVNDDDPSVISIKVVWTLFFKACGRIRSPD
jgi:hypothetical protein